MSLVAYGSSGESDDESSDKAVEEESSDNRINGHTVLNSSPGQLKQSSLLNLPGPKRILQDIPVDTDNINGETNINSNDELIQGIPLPFSSQNNEKVHSSLFSSLPAPKARMSGLVTELENEQNIDKKDRDSVHRKQTVKITVPALSEFNDEETIEPKPKKQKTPVKASGLFSLLPAPKSLSVKETKRPLVPHVLTKKTVPSVPDSSVATKKPAKLPSELISYADSGEESEGEETASVKTEDFFALSSNDQLDNVQQETLVVNPHPVVSMHDTTVNESSSSAFEESNQSSDEPLNFSSRFQPSPWAVTAQPKPAVQQTSWQEDNHPSASTDFIPVDTADLQLNKEALQRLCGRRATRQQQTMELIEVSGDAIMPDPNEWLTKQLTQEQETKVHSHSHRKNDGPTTQQRRKHQITYLAFQAKENELELKNQWSQNRMSRKQTQSKYGF